MKDINSGKLSMIYNAKEVLAGLKTPIVNDPKVSTSNSSTPALQHSSFWLMLHQIFKKNGVLHRSTTMLSCSLNRNV